VHAQSAALAAEAELVAATSTSQRECGLASQLEQGVMHKQLNLSRTEGQLVLARENVTAAVEAVQLAETTFWAVKPLMARPKHPAVIAEFDEKIERLPAEIKARLPVDSYSAAESALETVEGEVHDSAIELQHKANDKRKLATTERIAAQASVDHLDAVTLQLKASLEQEHGQAAAQGGLCTQAQTDAAAKTKHAAATLAHVSVGCAGFNLPAVAGPGGDTSSGTSSA